MTRTVKTNHTALTVLGMLTSNLTSVACVGGALWAFIRAQEQNLYSITIVALFLTVAYGTHVRYTLQQDDEPANEPLP